MTSAITKLLDTLKLESLPGFIVVLAALLVSDVYVKSDLVSNVFTDQQTAIVGGLTALVGALAFGLFLRSIYHWMGRNLARWTVGRLWQTLHYQDSLMRANKRSMSEFSVFYGSTEKDLRPETELLDRCRNAFTNGLALFLLAPALTLYLRFEAETSPGVSLTPAFLLVLVGIVLVVASYRTLVKYEERKTAATKSAMLNDGYTIPNESQITFGRREWTLRATGYLVFAIAVVIIGMVSVWTSEVDTIFGLNTENDFLPDLGIREDSLKTISEAEDGKVPVLELKATKPGKGNGINVSGTRPVVIAGDQISQLAISTRLISIVDSTSLSGPLRPKWKVWASVLGQRGEDRVEVDGGDTVVINAMVDFRTKIEVEGAKELQGTLSADEGSLAKTFESAKDDFKNMSGEGARLELFDAVRDGAEDLFQEIQVTRSVLDKLPSDTNTLTSEDYETLVGSVQLLTVYERRLDKEVSKYLQEANNRGDSLSTEIEDAIKLAEILNMAQKALTSKLETTLNTISSVESDIAADELTAGEWTFDFIVKDATDESRRYLLAQIKVSIGEQAETEEENDEE